MEEKETLYGVVITFYKLKDAQAFERFYGTQYFIYDDENEQEVKDEKLPELPHTSKYKLEDIEKTLKNVVHSSFDYFDYSTLDSSNKRFMEKQVNTNQLRDSLFGKNTQNDEIETTYNMNKKELNLFDNIENNAEFNEVCPF